MSQEPQVELNSQIRLMRVPDQKYPAESSDIFQIKYLPPVPISEVKENEVVMKNMFISIDATMRVWISGVPSYLPPVKPQDVMRAFCIGKVIYSKSNKFQVGDLAMGLLGWQKFAVIKDKQLTPIPKNYPNPQHFLGILGISGLTAYFGLHDIGKIKPNDTVVISAATGAVGQIAVQIAKNFGCHVCAIAGSDQKCQYAKKLGAETVINYKKQDVNKKLKQLYPNGVDVYFDNVGGKMLDDVLMNIANQARIVLCGLISTYGSKQPYRLKNYSRLIVKRAQMRGYLYFDYVKKFPQAILELQKQLKQGKITSRIDMMYGLEQCPRGLKRLLLGENNGKVMIQVQPKNSKQNPKL